MTPQKTFAEDVEATFVAVADASQACVRLVQAAAEYKKAMEVAVEAAKKLGMDHSNSPKVPHQPQVVQAVEVVRAVEGAQYSLVEMVFAVGAWRESCKFWLMFEKPKPASPANGAPAEPASAPPADAEPAPPPYPTIGSDEG